MAVFTSAVLGEVQHPKNTLREYLAAFRNKCQADILSWLDGWTYSKQDDWVWLVLSDLSRELGYCKDTVWRHLKNLCELGVIERREAKRWATDKAWEYRIVPETLTAFVCKNHENQTIDSPKTNHRQSENQPSTVQNQETLLDTFIDPPISSTTTVVVSACSVEEVKRAIADSPFVQESSDIDSTPQLESTGGDEFSAHHPEPVEEITDAERTPPPHIKKKLVFPCEKQLKLHRIDLNDEDLQRVAEKFCSNLNDAVDAWLEWVKTLSHVNKPTRSLIGAITKGWKPEKSRLRVEIKPPPPGVLDSLKQKFRSVLEIPWQGGWCWGVGIGNSVLPWWEAMSNG